MAANSRDPRRAARRHASSWPARYGLLGGTGESGQAMILIALMLVPMILMLALVVDLGVAYGEKRQLQNVADSGARAASQLLEKRARAGLTASDGEIVAAIADVALHSSGGLTGIGGCDVSGSGTGIKGIYTNHAGANLGPVGSGGAVPSNAWGVKLTPCKKVPTSFARVMGLNDISIGAASTWAFGVINQVTTDNGAYGPFAVWYGEVQKRYDPSNPKTPLQQCIDAANGDPSKEFGCIGVGSTIIYRANGWGDCPNRGGNGLVISESTCNDVNSIWTVGNANFKGDINHGNGWLPVGTIGDPETVVTNGGNADGQYIARLQYAASNYPHLMLMPLITEGKKVGGDIRIKTVGLACVKVNGPIPGNLNTPYTATIRAIGEEYERDQECHDLLSLVRAGEEPITETSVTVVEMIQ